MNERLEHIILGINFKRSWFWFGLIGLLIGLWILLYGTEFISDKSTLYRLLESISSTVFSIIIVGFAYQLLIAKNNRKLLKEDVAESLFLNNSLFFLLKHDKKLKYVEPIIKSLIVDSNYNKMLTDWLTYNCLSKNSSFRKNLKCEITIGNDTDKFDAFFETVGISKDRYFDINQSIQYSKHFNNVTSINDIDFKIFFGFNHESFEFWMDNRFVFFRDVISIDTLIDKVKEPSFDLQGFIKNVLNLKLSFLTKNGEYCNALYKASITNDNSGILIELDDINNFRKLFLIVDHYTCKLTFCQPFNINRNTICLIIPEPTIGIEYEINFDNKELLNNSGSISFLTDARSRLIKIPEHRKYKFQDNKLFLPRSGFVVYWSNE